MIFFAIVAGKMMAKFGCVSPLLTPNIFHPVCGSHQANVSVLDQSKWDLFYRKMVLYEKMDLCKMPCKKFTPYFGVYNEYTTTPGSIFKNKSYIRIRVDNTLAYTESVRDYPLISMLAGKWQAIGI